MVQGSLKTFASLHFLTETKINRDHQRLLTMVRTTLGEYMGLGWHVFRTDPNVPHTAQSLLDGLDQLAVEIREFLRVPMTVYKVCLTYLPKDIHLTSYFILTAS